MGTVRFHLAFPARTIEETKAYYVDGLGCEPGRESNVSLILNLYDHQLVAHISQMETPIQRGIYPRHFGLIFSDESEWEELRDRALENNLSFYMEPKRRFAGELIEHRTFFLADPFHNLMEFKFYCNEQAIFGATQYGRIGDQNPESTL